MTQNQHPLLASVLLFGVLQVMSPEVRWKMGIKGGMVKLAITAIATFFLASLSAVSQVEQQNKSTRHNEEAKRDKYESAEWGISFQYSSAYILKELNTPVAPDANWFPGRSIDGHPGAVDLVAVEIPNDLFPRTDLTRAVLSLTANRNVTAEECWASVAREAPMSSRKIDGVEFRWSEGADAVSAASFRDYAGFANGVCYEIEIAVVTTRHGPPEGTLPVNEAEINRRMDQLLNSVKIHSTDTSHNFPSILYIRVEKLPSPDPPASYRFLWDVQDSAEHGVTIDLNCYADPSMIEVTKLQESGAGVSCGTLMEVQPSKGSLDLSFANHTGVTLQPRVRLFARGRKPKSNLVEFSLETMPVIRGTTFMGRNLNGGLSAPLYPGQSYVLYGDAFLPNETAWIGETKVPATSADGRRLEFSVPSTLGGGSVAFHIEDTRGKSNVLTARVVRNQPRISFYIPADAGPAESRKMRNTPVVPGQHMRLVGVGFTTHNKVWIGSTSLESEMDERFPQFGLYFTIPDSLKAGIYPLSVTNDLGKSNEITLTLTSPD